MCWEVCERERNRSTDANMTDVSAGGGVVVGVREGSTYTSKVLHRIANDA
jgi:hypothetical protein